MSEDPGQKGLIVSDGTQVPAVGESIPSALVFMGAGSKRFPAEVQEILSRPFSDEEAAIRGDGIVYLPWIFVSKRFNEAFGRGAWAVVPRSEPKIQGKVIVYHGALIVDSRYIGEAYGDCEYVPSNPKMSYVSALEGAISDCITKLGKRLGVAEQFWDPNWRARWIKKYAHNPTRSKYGWQRKDQEGPDNYAPPAGNEQADYVPPTPRRETFAASAKVNRGQLARIHILKQELESLGVIKDDNDWRDRLSRKFSKTSSADLTGPEAEQLIEALAVMKARGEKKQERRDAAAQGATGMIAEYLGEQGISREDLEDKGDEPSDEEWERYKSKIDDET